MLAIAEFGSKSRNTSDAISDIDLLVVCPIRDRKKLHERYTAEGYSVTSLSENQLINMQRRGALFIQHLKHESKIVIDVGSRLRTFLASCELVKPDDGVLDTCEATLRFIARWPERVAICAWKADFLFCASRDYLIKRLARENKLAFGLEQIELESRNIFGSTAREFQELYTLREAKAAYRNGTVVPKELSMVIEKWLGVLNRRLEIGLPDTWLDDEPLNINLLPERFFSSDYERLRSLEGAYLISRAQGAFHPNHSHLMKYILQPNFYRSCQKSKREIIQQYLSEVVELTDINAIPRHVHPIRFFEFQTPA